MGIFLKLLFMASSWRLEVNQLGLYCCPTPDLTNYLEGRA
jgi:hypothetical protein